MNKLMIYIIGIVLVASLVLAQTFTLPSTFTINSNFAGLPSPQANQKIFGCPYVFPIQLRDVKIWDYQQQGANVNLNVSFSLYTNNKRNACNINNQIISVSVLNWNTDLASYITTNSNNNINNEAINNNPLGIGGAG